MSIWGAENEEMSIWETECLCVSNWDDGGHQSNQCNHQNSSFCNLYGNKLCGGMKYHMRNREEGFTFSIHKMQTFTIKIEIH